MSARVGVVVFPGSNCELDCKTSLGRLGAEVEMIWHDDRSLGDVDVVVLPGGFAHGDYLRTGAIARFSPIMLAVSEHAAAGGIVLGICNGFQVLCEAGLLPGALRKNASLKFICRWTELRVDNADTPLTELTELGQKLRIPINHFEGNYYVDEPTFQRMRGEGQIVLRYTNNPNGSLDDIAAIANSQGNVFGMMPHPERACDGLLGSTDGALLFGSLLESVLQRVGV
jgi:phosphoribosylformylglycinamidine synthase I